MANVSRELDEQHLRRKWKEMRCYRREFKRYVNKRCTLLPTINPDGAPRVNMAALLLIDLFLRETVARGEAIVEEKYNSEN